MLEPSRRRQPRVAPPKYPRDGPTRSDTVTWKEIRNRTTAGQPAHANAGVCPSPQTREQPAPLLGTVYPSVYLSLRRTPPPYPLNSCQEPTRLRADRKTARRSATGSDPWYLPLDTYTRARVWMPPRAVGTGRRTTRLKRSATGAHPQQDVTGLAPGALIRCHQARARRFAKCPPPEGPVARSGRQRILESFVTLTYPIDHATTAARTPCWDIAPCFVDAHYGVNARCGVDAQKSSRRSAWIGGNLVIAGLIVSQRQRQSRPQTRPAFEPALTARKRSLGHT